MARGHAPPVKTEDMIAALKATDGMVYLAAERLDCDVSTIYKRIPKDKKLARVIDQSRGKLLDMGETQLKRAVLDGAAWAVCFLLKTRGKARGYIEHTNDPLEKILALLPAFVAETIRREIGGIVSGVGTAGGLPSVAEAVNEDGPPHFIEVAEQPARTDNDEAGEREEEDDLQFPPGAEDRVEE
jgi:hypothetical protein